VSTTLCPPAASRRPGLSKNTVPTPPLDFSALPIVSANALQN
jgi:hypothetical protein